MVNIEIEVKCNKCGTKAELDKEKSNKNWEAYKTREPCKCGGKFQISISGGE